MSSNLNKLISHLRTIKAHRKHVRRACFHMGLWWQGLTHDLSKYSIVELGIYKWYTGTRSPHAECRSKSVDGYSPSWNHHYHRNKHHWQYWLDIENWCDGGVVPMKIPYKYVVEMFCDFIGAGKAYCRDVREWKASIPYKYWVDRCVGKRLMHKDSERLFVYLLRVLNAIGDEDKFYTWYKKHKQELKKNYN